MARPPGLLAAACLVLAMAQTPAHALVAATTFHVKNCTSERVFVCSFDKTDGLMNVPYKAAGIKPGGRKEFGCASLDKCKVIIGVSKRHAKTTLSSGMKAAVAAGGSGGGAVAGGGGGAGVVYLLEGSVLEAMGIVGTAGAVLGGAVVAVGVGGAIAGIEIGDGWSDGEVCDQVKKAARKANLKPKHFLDNGKNYRVIEKYAVDKDGNPYVYADGTAVFAYETTHKLNNCPAPLKAQLVPN